MSTTLTKPELSSRIKYGYWYNILHARLYRRLDYAFTGAQLLMGSYVINGLIKEFSRVEVIASALIAVVGVIQQLWSLQAHKAVHQMAAADYLGLEKQLDSLTCDEAADRLYDLYGKYPDGLDSIEQLAQRIVTRMHDPEKADSNISMLAKIIDCIV